ncbi:MAG: 3-phosphoserine/phosphohydroxythreonine transaminase [Selenomonadaceae bacterium]|nr:3-phosphoserine/phosphohydroxythreonine transaminase [Selenomonadaceae bacterium]MBQ7628798.1 3-phosphoserine/phosphohydroxythreonine transaminase [Selenomonadaceae bacterium]
MLKRVYNFNPGPATLPLDVLQEVQAEFLNFDETGMSIVEISHRAKPYEKVHNQAKATILELMNLGDDYEVLFIQGGASLQFAMIPMNFASQEKFGSYAVSGIFANNAYKEAKNLGVGKIAASTESENFSRVPRQDELIVDKNSAYLHICMNNTIYGTEYHYIPEVGEVPLFADMSSNMLSRPLDFKKFSFIYAGVQKNLGPAGVVIVVAKKSFIEKSLDRLPTMLRYDTFYKKNSLYNTPPVFSIYVVGKVAQWIKNNGGLKVMAQRNFKKAQILYNIIDESDGFYKGHAQKDSRSFMNVTFRLPNEELEKKFVAEALENNISGVKGHRLVGGMRASIYNAMPLEGVEVLAEFMKKFQRKNLDRR